MSSAFDPAMLLSPSFRLGEFLHSAHAVRLGRTIEPTAENVANLERLATTILEPLRAWLREPILIDSGLRPAWLNEMTPGSAKTSAHIDGRAGDIIVRGISPYKLCLQVIELGVPFDQLIYEGSWTHVSVADIADVARGQVLTARFTAEGPHYLEGLHA